MKKGFFVGIFILLSFVLIARISTVNAQDTVVKTDTPVGIDTPQSTESAQPQRVNYELAYPGMLPDNPFYFLKVIRDGIVKLLINDPLKKAEFSLLNAEKRMYAGKMLIQKGEQPLALTTIEKSNNYLDDAGIAVKDALNKNPKNTDIKLFLEKFKMVSLKNREVLSDMEQSIDGKYLDRYKWEEKRVEDSEKNVEQLLQNQ